MRTCTFQSAPLREGRRGQDALTDPLEERFQSAPLREGRPSFQCMTVSGRRFQSAPLREGRLGTILTWLQERDGVSIRAPARGATYLVPPWLTYMPGFNPRPCARGDAPIIFDMFRFARLFQSAPLREGRRKSPRENPH